MERDLCGCLLDLSGLLRSGVVGGKGLRGDMAQYSMAGELRGGLAGGASSRST